MTEAIAVPSGIMSKIERFADPIAMATLAVLVFFTQFGSLEIDQLVTDEATFILLGVSLLEGNLPYTELFDNKPPLMFALVAAAFALFGESLLVFRLLGDVFLWSTATLVYVIGRQFADALPAFLGAVLLVAISASNPGQFTNTEFPAMTFLMGATLLIMRYPKSFAALFFAGVLVSLATLTRTNLAIVAVGMTVIFALSKFLDRDRWLHPLAFLAALLGGALPAIMLVGLYWQSGHIDSFLLGMITVPLNFATDQQTTAEIIAQHWLYWLDYIQRFPLMFGVYSAILTASLIACLARLSRTGATYALRAPLLMALFATISVLMSGIAYRHYWLQVLPFLNLATILLFQQAQSRPVLRYAAMLAVALPMGAAARYHMPEALRAAFVPEWAAKGQQLRVAANQIRPYLDAEDEIWALENHIMLWYLDRKPMHPAISHPENIVRPSIIEPLTQAGYAPSEPVEWVYAREPAFIILGPKIPFYMQGNAGFELFLRRGYSLYFELPRVRIFRRLGHGGWTGRG